MAIKNLLGDVGAQAVATASAALSQKVSEGADKVVSSIGGWNGFNRLTSRTKDKTQTAANFFTQQKKLEAQGLSEAEVDEAIRKMSPIGEATDLDKLQADLNLAAAVDTEITARQLKEVLGTGANDDLVGHKVKLVEKGVDIVIFNIMPEVVESRTVEYEAVAPPQYPSAFQKYRGTSSTQWTVNATLTCRNTDEATENLRIINVLRGWTMPFFGDKIKSSYPDKLGAPPPVLEFSGWRNQMVGPVQVVITSLNWNFPQDVDYIPARGFIRNTDSAGGLEFSGELIPFPTVIKVAIQLVESFSTDQLNGFDLAAFRTGQMDQAFKQRLSIEASTGRSAQGLLRGGAVSVGEAQVVSGNPLGEAARAASSISDSLGVAPVTEVLEVGAPSANAETSLVVSAPPVVDNTPITAWPAPPVLSVGTLDPDLPGSTKDEQIAYAQGRVAAAAGRASAYQRNYDAAVALANELEAAGSSAEAQLARLSASQALQLKADAEATQAYLEAQILQLQTAKTGGA